MSRRRVVDVSVRVVLVLAVLFTGLAAAMVMAGRSRHSTEASRQELATRATIDIRATTHQIIASLSGVGALFRSRVSPAKLQRPGKRRRAGIAHHVA